MLLSGMLLCRLLFAVCCLQLLSLQAVVSAAMSSRPSTITSAAEISADCQLRSFAAEFATWLQPLRAVSNWTAAVEQAFEMSALCSGQSSVADGVGGLHAFPAPPVPVRPQAGKRAEQLLADCPHRVYVDGRHGDDGNDGTLEQPMKSIGAGLQRTRAIRLLQPHSAPPLSLSPGAARLSICLVLRNATYYLGSSMAAVPGFTSSELSSRIGAIALTAFDSGLTITAFPGEENAVILSGGVLLDRLRWKPYARTPSGDVLRAVLPAGLDLSFRSANELYADDWRLIRAKFPNSDPSTQGLWTEPTGWLAGAESWLPPRPFPPVVDVLVERPLRNGTFFPSFHSAVGGRCSVFEPPAGYWCSDAPPAGGSFSNPSGLVDAANLGSRVANWSRPEQGYVHVMHGSLWGSWVFAIDSVDVQSSSVAFGAGGTQEGRGAGSGGAYYISNILQELDYPGEWYVDADNATLFLMPNNSLPGALVLSQLPCLISVSGSREQPVTGVTLHGLTLTQTANTYMRLHEMPSGGDFSLHRGAAVFVTGSSGFSFTHNLLHQLGSNGVTLSDWNLNASIAHNEIAFVGGSAVQIAGSARDIDGVSNVNQPHDSHVQLNLIHDIGIYIKQSAAVLHSLARASRIEGNVMFNAPRMHTCFNDGFAGGHVLAYNLGFNQMRETGDAGVFESWDRQPYLTRTGDAPASLSPAYTHEHHNLAYVNYHTDAVINHDDGSSWYEDYFNLFVYCVAGFQTYLGHNKHYHDELTIYPDYVEGRPCFETNQSPGSLQFDEVYTGNSCVQRRPLQTYGIRSCEVESLVQDVGLVIDNSTFYYPAGALPYFLCNQNGTARNFTLAEWRAATGLDLHSQTAVSPPIATIVHWARQQLLNNTNLHSRPPHRHLGPQTA